MRVINAYIAMMKNLKLDHVRYLNLESTSVSWKVTHLCASLACFFFSFFLVLLDMFLFSMIQNYHQVDALHSSETMDSHKFCQKKNVILTYV